MVRSNPLPIICTHKLPTEENPPLMVIRGGGDLASGVALRLWKAGFRVLIAELPQPLAVRRLVSFAEAVYSQRIMIEGVIGELVEKPEDINILLKSGKIPVIVDPELMSLNGLTFSALIDARMKKAADSADCHECLVIGLGPGFEAGENCHAVVETMRGPFLGRVYWKGSALSDTGVPESVSGYTGERVLRAVEEGLFIACSHIGEQVRQKQILGTINETQILAPFDGVVRGLLKSGVFIRLGGKVGDVDPRGDRRLCTLVSDKALAVGGGVLEALLTPVSLRF